MPLSRLLVSVGNLWRLQEYKLLVDAPQVLGGGKNVARGKIKDFLDQDIVFVRMKGSPWWPARIAPDASGTHLIGKKYHVIFCKTGIPSAFVLTRLLARLP
jgi:hypothetical protein